MNQVEYFEIELKLIEAHKDPLQSETVYSKKCRLSEVNENNMIVVNVKNIS
jgi:hypothetical protein